MPTSTQYWYSLRKAALNVAVQWGGGSQVSVFSAAGSANDNGDVLKRQYGETLEWIK